MFYNLIPAGVSLVLGIIFVLMSEARPLVKLLVAAVFVLGAYFQFFTGYRLAGMLIQVALALGLVFWLKFA